MSGRAMREGVRNTQGWVSGREARNQATGRIFVPEPVPKRVKNPPQPPLPEPSSETTPPQADAISEAQVGQDIALVRSQLRRGVLQLSKNPDGKIVFKQNGRPINLLEGSITPHDGAEPVYYRAEFAEALRREVIQIQGSRNAAETTLREIAQHDPKPVRDLEAGVFASPGTKDTEDADTRALIAFMDRSRNATRVQEEAAQRRREDDLAKQRGFESRRMLLGKQLLFEGQRTTVGAEADSVVVTDVMREVFTNLVNAGEYKEEVRDGNLVVSRTDHYQRSSEGMQTVYAEVDPVTGHTKPTSHTPFGVAIHPNATAVIRERMQNHKALREKLGISPNRHEDAVWQAQFDRSIQILLRTGVAEEAQRLAAENGVEFVFETDPVELGEGVWPSIRLRGKEIITSAGLGSVYTSDNIPRHDVPMERGFQRVAIIQSPASPDVGDSIVFEVHKGTFEDFYKGDGIKRERKRKLESQNTIAGAIDRESAVQMVKETFDRLAGKSLAS